jgi:aminoglycoside phosphotransferase (APT) family kinase protein
VLGRDHNGDPAFVMKRIEGPAWSEALEADRAEPDRMKAPLPFPELEVFA